MILQHLQVVCPVRDAPAVNAAASAPSDRLPAASHSVQCSCHVCKLWDCLRVCGCREEEEWDEAEAHHAEHNEADAGGDGPDDQLPVNTLFYGVRGQQVCCRLYPAHLH